MPGSKNIDIRITNGVLLTINKDMEIFEKGEVHIRGDRIVYAGQEPDTPVQASRTIDAEECIIMPGMVNAHTHCGMSLFRTLADDHPDRLRRFIFPLEKKFVTPELVYWASLHGIREMIEGGVTTFTDMYYFEEQVAEAAEQAGIRGVLGETIVNFPAPDAAEPYGGMVYAGDFVRKYKGHSLITPAVAPHAPYTLDAEHLEKTAHLAEEWDVPVLTHLAEMPFEVEQIHREHGMSPTAWYHSLGLLNPRLVAAHCIFVDDEDIRLLKGEDAGIAHNPVANMKGGKGIAPAVKMLDEGLRLGMGTDGPMSGNTLDLINLMGYTAKIHKLDRRDRTVLAAPEVVHMATMGGAKALHREDEIGSLEAGKKADVAVVSTKGTSMYPIYDYYSALVYSAGPSDVETVIVDGRIVLERKKIITFDPGKVKRETDKIVSSIKKDFP